MMTLLTRQSALTVVALGVAIFAGFIMANTTYNVQGYLLVALVLLIVMVFFVIPRVAAGEGKNFLLFLYFAFAMKIAASTYRLYWAFIVKDGVADAFGYDTSGRRIAEAIWHLDFGPLVDSLEQGTLFVKAINGVIYSITGPTLPGGYLLYSCFTFIAACLYYRAFRTVIPNGNRILFAGLIFLFPSWLYWPSSIGKDSLMALFIGLIAYGTAHLLCRGKLWMIALIVLGLSGTLMIRPHITALIGAGLSAAIILRPYRLGSLGPVLRGGMIAVAGVLSVVLVNQAATFLNLEEVSVDAAIGRYESLQGRARGGAGFDPVSITDPVGIPLGVVTVLFRPFPWEAHRGAALILSLEGIVFLGIALWRLGSIKNAILAARSNPFLVFALVYVVISILAFTTFGNFSILGRERVQFFPLLFLLLAFPNGREKKQEHAQLALAESQASHDAQPGTQLPYRSLPGGGVK